MKKIILTTAVALSLTGITKAQNMGGMLKSKAKDTATNKTKESAEKKSQWCKTRR
jgi:hypothetical protein